MLKENGNSKVLKSRNAERSNATILLNHRVEGSSQINMVKRGGDKVLQAP
jgi:hypothetical protein